MNDWLKEIAERVESKNEAEQSRKSSVQRVSRILDEIVTELQEDYNVKANVEKQRALDIWDLRIDDKQIKIDMSLIDEYSKDYDENGNEKSARLDIPEAIERLILDKFKWK